MGGRSDSLSQVRSTVRFTGRVQGVGFRATVAQISRDFDVRGWVRNESDGSVLCVAEGRAEELERFIAAISERMSGYVRKATVERSNATGEFDDFRIAY